MYVSSSKPKQWKRQFRHKAFNCVCIQKKRSVYRKNSKRLMQFIVWGHDAHVHKGTKS